MRAADEFGGEGALGVLQAQKGDGDVGEGAGVVLPHLAEVAGDGGQQVFVDRLGGDARAVQRGGEGAGRLAVGVEAERGELADVRLADLRLDINGPGGLGGAGADPGHGDEERDDVFLDGLDENIAALGAKRGCAAGRPGSFALRL